MLERGKCFLHDIPLNSLEQKFDNPCYNFPRKRVVDFVRYQGSDSQKREPKNEPYYGTVAVFEDLYGNLWDLLQLKDP